jgi:hypothetical protein
MLFWTLSVVVVGDLGVDVIVDDDNEMIVEFSGVIKPNVHHTEKIINKIDKLIFSCILYFYCSFN